MLNHTSEQQVEFYVIKDSITISDTLSVSNSADSTYLFPQPDQQTFSDSLFQVLTSPVTATTEITKDYGFIPKLKTQYLTNWSIVTLVILFIILASIRTSSEKYVIQIFQSIFNRKIATRLYREKVSTIAHVSFRLDMFFIVVSGLFIFQITNYIMQFQSRISLIIFALCLGLFLAYIIIKFLLYRISGAIFDANSETREYIFYAKTGNRIMGLILFPIVVSLFFVQGKPAEFLFITGGIIILILNIISMLNGVKVIAEKVFSVYYMILYLCTLEILPLLLVWRILWRK